jgi:DNA helicase-2/ATP-dependent DNA helicase PcrA
MAATDAEIPLLTTAANLLSGSAESVKLPTGFAVGMTVRHPRYGLGTVTEVRGFSKRGTVEVSFEDDDRVATFDLSRCPLQPVGTR